MDLVLVQQENIAGAPVEAGVEVEARLIFRGADLQLGPPPQGIPVLGGEWAFHKLTRH